MATPIERKEGRVVRFGALNGYGFIQPDGSDDTVFVHATSIRPSNMGSFANGARVEFSYKDNRAFDIQPIGRGMAKGHVRNFNERKGFGFIELDDVDGLDVPIFVHSSSIRRWGKPTLREGESVELLVVETSKGFQGIDVRMRDRTSVHGGIRWFDPVGTGRGQIISDRDGSQLHFDISGITRIGQRRLIPNERVTFSLQKQRRGLVAVDVAVLSDRMVHRPEDEPMPDIKHHTAVELARIAAEIRQAEIKSMTDIELAKIKAEAEVKKSNNEKTAHIVGSVAGVMVAIVHGIAYVLGED